MEKPTPRHYPLSHPFWLSAVGIYGVLLGLKKSNIYLIGISDYLADLLAMPVILGIIGWAWRQQSGKSSRPLPRLYVATTVFIFALLFEWIFPIYTSRFTADPWDIACYTLGALAFCRWLNRA